MSFFVSAGITTFFSEDELFLSVLCALCVFLVLSTLTLWLTHKTKHKKTVRNERKSF